MKNEDKDKGSVDDRPVYHGDQDADRLPYEGPGIRTDASGENRGRRAAEGSGVVVGSGAGAGGGGNEEDFDSDPVGGGGSIPMPVDRKHTPVSDDKGEPISRTSGTRGRTTSD
jgi:hypothetical protein